MSGGIYAFTIITGGGGTLIFWPLASRNKRGYEAQMSAEEQQDKPA